MLHFTSNELDKKDDAVCLKVGLNISKPLRILVMVAAKAVALSSPTPTPFSKAWVARVPVMELAKA